MTETSRVLGSISFLHQMIYLSQAPLYLLKGRKIQSSLMSQPDLLFLAFVQLIPPPPELRFVATVTTGGHVKFVPAV